MNNTYNLKNIRYIDFHTHMHDEAFDVGDDRDRILREVWEGGIACVTIGTDISESKKAKELSQRYENVFYTVGAHPHDLLNAEFDEGEFEKLLDEKCVAIGECGLDYFYLKGDKEAGKIENIDREVDRQRELFKSQIDFAITHNLPLMIHGRPSARDEIDNPSGMDAYEDIIFILKNTLKRYGNLSEETKKGFSKKEIENIEKFFERKMRGNMHFFVGSIDIARECMDLGFTFSFGGVLTITDEYDDLVKSIPLEYIHAETDSPYVSPKDKDGNRLGERVNGKIRNDSRNISRIVEKIAELKGESLETVREKLKENFLNFIK